MYLEESHHDQQCGEEAVRLEGGSREELLQHAVCSRNTVTRDIKIKMAGVTITIMPFVSRSSERSQSVLQSASRNQALVGSSVPCRREATRQLMVAVKYCDFVC